MMRLKVEQKIQVIAEIGANHDGSLERAHRMVDAVADAGAHFCKFQLYNSEELVAAGNRSTTWGPPGHQRTEMVSELFGRLSLAPEALTELFFHARERGLVPFASAFSEAGIDMLVKLGVPLLKIAASDVNHLPLLAHAAKTRLPIILSLGKCTLAEADEAVRCLEETGAQDISLLHCVASYPSPMNEMNLRTIPMLASAYPEHVIGFSDHSLGLTAPITAAALGARIIEKHVTMSRKDEGPDHWFSLEMHELAALVQAMADVSSSLGTSRKIVTASEEGGRNRATRSIFTTRYLPAGSVLGHGDLKCVRPGGGIPPRELANLVGMRLTRDVSSDTQLGWHHLQALSTRD